jgi:hypothetical protein
MRGSFRLSGPLGAEVDSAGSAILYAPVVYEGEGEFDGAYLPLALTVDDGVARPGHSPQQVAERLVAQASYGVGVTAESEPFSSFKDFFFTMANRMRIPRDMSVELPQQEALEAILAAGELLGAPREHGRG